MKIINLKDKVAERFKLVDIKPKQLRHCVAVEDYLLRAELNQRYEDLIERCGGGTLTTQHTARVIAALKYDDGGF